MSLTARARSRRRRAVSAIAGLAATLSAVPSTAAAQNDGRGGPAPIPVSAALGACETSQAGVVCEIQVSFPAIDAGERYDTVISAPSGEVLLTATAHPGATTYPIQYRGDGTYLVRITAYGQPNAR